MQPESGFFAFAVRYGSRSLARNKRRTILVVATVALSTVVSLIGMSYATAIIRIWAKGAIDYGLGHAQVHTAPYWDNPDVLRDNHLLKDDNALLAELAASPEVLALSRRIKFEGTVSSANKSIYFLGVAVSPESELKVAPEIFHPGMDQGQFLSGAAAQGVVVGRLLAENLGLAVGDSASLTTISLGGSSNATDVIVRGIVDTPLPALSKRLVYMDLTEAQKALILPGVSTELAVVLRNEEDLDAWAARWRPRLKDAGLNLKTWYELDPLIKRGERIGKSVVAFLCFLLFISSGISVANIVYLLVAERTVEIGTLMALGARPRDIKRLFVVEAGIIAFFGGIVGAVTGVFTIVTMDLIGIPFKSPFHSGLLEVHPKVDVPMTLLVTFVALVICYVAALLPARAAGRVEPVVAFRGQLS